jgi:hypothetical protein
VDHSIITYLIDPDGEFVTFYGKNFTAQQLADSISEHVRKRRGGGGEGGGGGGEGGGGGGGGAAKGRQKGQAGSQEGQAQAAR